MKVKNSCPTLMKISCRAVSVEMTSVLRPSESFVFKSVLQWIKYKKEERMEVAAKVIGVVRLGLVDIKEVIEELNTEEMQRVPEIQKLVSDSLLYSHMPSPSSEFAVEKAKPRSMSPVRMIYKIHFPPKLRTLLISDVLFKLANKLNQGTQHRALKLPLSDG